jgi:hypothetical protein
MFVVSRMTLIGAIQSPDISQFHILGAVAIE